MVTLFQVEEYATSCGLILRLHVNYFFNLWTFEIVIVRPRENQQATLLGKMKGWAYGMDKGLQLDTLRIQGEYTSGVGILLWAATFAWALEYTPCRSARLLAINDEKNQHRRLVRYFKRIGFQTKKLVLGRIIDIPLRLVWGGSGLIMQINCHTGLLNCKYWLSNTSNDYQVENDASNS